MASGSLRTGWSKYRGQNQSQPYAKAVESYTMKIVRQNLDECMLTTISALSRVPIVDVRKMAYELSQCESWKDVVVNHPLYWMTIKQLTKDVGLLDRKIPTCSRKFTKGNKRLYLPEGIEGSISSEASNYEYAHIDPFSNGLIFSTYDESPVCLEVYRKHLTYKKCKITGIWY